MRVPSIERQLAHSGTSTPAGFSGELAAAFSPTPLVRFFPPPPPLLLLPPAPPPPQPNSFMSRRIEGTILAWNKGVNLRLSASLSSGTVGSAPSSRSTRSVPGLWLRIDSPMGTAPKRLGAFKSAPCLDSSRRIESPAGVALNELAWWEAEYPATSLAPGRAPPSSRTRAVRTHSALSRCCVSTPLSAFTTRKFFSPETTTIKGVRRIREKRCSRRAFLPALPFGPAASTALATAAGTPIQHICRKLVWLSSYPSPTRLSPPPTRP
mmetsp:Transcript_982/g.1623  ORF Transcript_982/g.1623 Transcript_982/m.1623 type:complete len:266 (-) Transcript_982:679-1476(-)